MRVHKIAGSNCPEGWLLDSEGRPTTDPDTLYGDPPGTILPMGGAQTYKGFGLALMVELLTGALSGGLCARETPETPKGNCVFLQLFSPSHFGDPDHFRREAEALIRFVRQTRTAEGVASITLPGDPERAQRRRAAAEGVAYEARNWEMLTQTRRAGWRLATAGASRRIRSPTDERIAESNVVKLRRVFRLPGS